MLRPDIEPRRQVSSIEDLASYSHILYYLHQSIFRQLPELQECNPNFQPFETFRSYNIFPITILVERGSFLSFTSRYRQIY